MKRVLYSLLLAVILIWPSAAKASTVLYSVDYVVGINDLVVGADHYNVDFEKGTLDGLFGYDYSDNSFATEPFFWGQASKANDTLEAINSTLNSESDVPFIIENAGGYYLIPYEVQINGDVRDAILCKEGRRLCVDDHNEYSNYGSSNWSNSEHYYARISPVPIPGAVWLLASGLIGIVGFKRKFQK